MQQNARTCIGGRFSSARRSAHFQARKGYAKKEAARIKRPVAEIDRTGDVWLYRPSRHKTKHRAKERIVAIGPKAQAIILEFVRIRGPICGVEGRPPRIGCRNGATCWPCADSMDEQGSLGPLPRAETQLPDAVLFSPRQDQEERFEDMRARRKSKVQPSQVDRKKTRPKRSPKETWDRRGYQQTVARAVKASGVPHWHVNQLRHTHAPAIRKALGLEAAQAALGHARADVTQVYAERDLGLARKVAREMG